MKLLLATYNFPPEAYGGTEVYVEALARHFARRGHTVEVICGVREAGLSRAEAPRNGAGRGASRFMLQGDAYHGLPVWRLRLDGERFSLPELYTTRAPDLEAFWRNWLTEHAPDLLHMHGHSLAASSSLVATARGLGIPVMFTLHHVTLLCPRGDYITFRGPVCDGIVELRKCTECVVATRSNNKTAGAAVAALVPLLSRLPVSGQTSAGASRRAGTPCAGSGPRGGGHRWRRALRFPALLRMRLESLEQTLGSVTLWHVFSEWTRAALEANGVPAERVVLRRHPLPQPFPASRTVRPAKTQPTGLRVGFFGRFHLVKGLGLLLDALELVPSAPVQLEVYGKAQEAGDEPLARRLAEAAARDQRIHARGWIDYAALPTALAELDVVVVPSLGIETGPFTVLEAFAAGLPVVGADISGISEWIRDGHNGLLFPRGDARGLANCLERLSRDPEQLARLREFPELESMEAHGEGIEELYRRLAPAVMPSR